LNLPYFERGIQKDAEELLVYMYKEYTKEDDYRIPSQEFIQKHTSWSDFRFRRAINYLTEKCLISTITFKGEEVILRITSKGVDAIETPSKFKKHFNHEVDLKLYKFSWGASEV